GVRQQGKEKAYRHDELDQLAEHFANIGALPNQVAERPNKLNPSEQEQQVSGIALQLWPPLSRRIMNVC
ncbi:hypothetical protein, partial [Escherichia coli]|uniref:hypothetical protein n=1 Tax=Escherichia coli TaxID=562 RepID=UPI00289E5F4A